MSNLLASLIILLGAAPSCGTIPFPLASGQADDALPQAPLPRLGGPRALISFPPGRHLYTLRINVETTDERRYALVDATIDQFDAATARDLLLFNLRDANFVVEKAGDLGLVIRGVKKSDGTVVAISSSKLIIRGVDDEKPSRAQPTITGLGGVTTEIDK